jgi:hypothetical protein
MTKIPCEPILRDYFQHKVFRKEAEGISIHKPDQEQKAKFCKKNTKQ